MRFHHVFRDEHGLASVVVALSMTVIMGMVALAVDLGHIHLKRARLQTAADTAALAGANSLLAYGRDFTGLRAVIRAYAARNMDEADQVAVAIQDADIVFLGNGAPDPDDPDQVEVTITLSRERENPLALHFGGVIGVPVVDLSVTARAGLVPVCGSKCVKPFVVPTKFEWDDYADPGTKGYGNGELDVESPGELASVNVFGYDQGDVGTQIIIKPGDPQLAIAPGQYNLVDLPPVNKGDPVTGADAVRENIAGCTGSNDTLVEPGDELLLEPGNSAGPVKQGVNDLLGEDPYAYWDSSRNAVEGSVYDDPMDSPRVALMAFYDPRQPPISGRNSIYVYELGAFFIEGVDGQGNVSARFINAVAVDPDPSGNDDCILRMSRLLMDSSRS